MLEKGRKRQERSVAVVYFVIGLITLLGILAILYFALFEVDYTDQIKDTENTPRPYVETTPVPDNFVEELYADVTPIPEMLDAPEPTEYNFEYDYADEEAPVTDADPNANGSIEETPVEETPVEEIPIIVETPIEQTPVEQAGAEEASVEGESAAADPFANEQPVEGAAEDPLSQDMMENADTENTAIETVPNNDWTEAEIVDTSEADEGESVLADTPEPTPLAVEETPVPEATAEETPIPDEAVSFEAESTPVPSKLIAKAKTKGFTVPKKPSDEDGRIGLTECVLSAADNNSVMRLAGYGYRDVENFDGERTQSYLVVTKKSSGSKKAYQLTMTEGISGLPHTGAKCANADACDWECYIDVSNYAQDIYNISLVLGYKRKGHSTHYYYYVFDDTNTFTVVGGQVVSPLTANATE